MDGETETGALNAYIRDLDGTLDVLCAKDAGVQAVLYLPENACLPGKPAG